MATSARIRGKRAQSVHRAAIATTAKTGETATKGITASLAHHLRRNSSVPRVHTVIRRVYLLRHAQVPAPQAFIVRQGRPSNAPQTKGVPRAGTATEGKRRTNAPARARPVTTAPKVRAPALQTSAEAHDSTAPRDLARRRMCRRSRMERTSPSLRTATQSAAQGHRSA